MSVETFDSSARRKMKTGQLALQIQMERRKISKWSCCTFLKEANSIITSGDYERYYKAEDGKYISHIVDPSTMYPARLYRFCHNYYRDSAAADCLSSNSFITLDIDEETSRNFSKASGKKCNAIWITEDEKTQGHKGKKVGNYTVIYTDGIEEDILWN